MLFQYTIKEDDNSIFEDNEIELDFLDPYGEEFYELNELESLVSNDVSEFGNKLSTIIDLQKVKETISKYKKWYFSKDGIMKFYLSNEYEKCFQ